MSGPVEGHRDVFQRRTVKVQLYGGDWQQRINAAVADVQEAEERYRDALKREQQPNGPMRLMGDLPESKQREDEWKSAIKTHDDLVEAAKADGVVEVTLQALPRKKWGKLVAAHPPRTDESVSEKDRANDAELGVNDESFGEALVPISIIEVTGTDLAVDDLVDEVSEAQFALLYAAAWVLNKSVGAAPKAISASTPISSVNSE